MSRENATTLDTIRALIKDTKDSEGIDPKTRDILLFSAIIDIYGQLERLQPIMTFYQVGLYFASALGVSVLALLFGLLTGQVELAFK